MHFQNLQDRHKLCIFNITLFAYDFLFEQHRNSHDKCLMNRSTSNQGAWHDYYPSSGTVQSIFGESLKGQIAWSESPSESLGELDMDSSNESYMIKRISSDSMATQHYRQ